MEQIANFIWEVEEEEKNPCSILLQQVICGKESYLMGCIFDGTLWKKRGCEAGGYFTKALGEWFHNCCLPNRRKTEICFRLLGERIGELEKELEERYGDPEEITDLSYLVWLSLGDRFYYVKKGKGTGQLLYRKYDKKKSRELLSENGTLKGSCQRDAVILLSNGNFEQGIDKQMLLDSLDSVRVRDKEQLKKYMKELCREAKRNGEKDPKAAIVIVMR